jgi:hypothetical protein
MEHLLTAFILACGLYLQGSGEEETRRQGEDEIMGDKKSVLIRRIRVIRVLFKLKINN